MFPLEILQLFAVKMVLGVVNVLLKLTLTKENRFVTVKANEVPPIARPERAVPLEITGGSKCIPVAEADGLELREPTVTITENWPATRLDGRMQVIEVKLLQVGELHKKLPPLVSVTITGDEDVPNSVPVIVSKF